MPPPEDDDDGREENDRATVAVSASISIAVVRVDPAAASCGAAACMTCNLHVGADMTRAVCDQQRCVSPAPGRPAGYAAFATRPNRQTEAQTNHKRSRFFKMASFGHGSSDSSVSSAKNATDCLNKFLAAAQCGMPAGYKGVTTLEQLPDAILWNKKLYLDFAYWMATQTKENGDQLYAIGTVIAYQNRLLNLVHEGMLQTYSNQWRDQPHKATEFFRVMVAGQTTQQSWLKMNQKNLERFYFKAKKDKGQPPALEGTKVPLALSDAVQSHRALVAHGSDERYFSAVHVIPIRFKLISASLTSRCLTFSRHAAASPSLPTR
jgi:hypothetical protein